MFEAPKPFNQIQWGGLPNMAGTLTSWMIPMVFNKITKVVENAEVTETTVDLRFSGVWQPLSTKQLMLKPFGQRAFGWFMLHTQVLIDLKLDDVVKYNGVQYRVMAKSDYKEYGYFYHELCEDYAGLGPVVEVTP